MPDPHAAAIEELLRHREWALRLARGLVRDEHRADDVVQDSFLAMLRRPPGTHDAPQAWLARVVRSWAARGGRSESRRARHESLPRPSGETESASDVVARADLHRFLANAVFELGEPYRTALLLRYFDGLTVKEVAAKMDTPLETTRTRLKRGLAEMRRRLEERGRGDGSDWRAGLVVLLAGGRPKRRWPRGVGTAAAAVVVGVAGVAIVRAQPLSAGAGATSGDPRAAVERARAVTRSARLGRATETRETEEVGTSLAAGSRDDSAPGDESLPVRHPVGSLGGDTPWVDAAGLVTSLAFLPDGRTLVSGASDGTVKLWDTDSGRVRRTLRGTGGAVNCVAVAPGGRVVLCGGADAAIRVCDAESGAASDPVTVHATAVREIACGPNGLVASSDTGGAVVVWRLAGHEVLARLQLDTDSGYARSLAFSADGRFLAAAGTKYAGVRVWTISGSVVSPMPNVAAGLGRVCRFARGGAAVWSAASDALVLSTPAGDELRRVAGVAGEVTAADLVSEGLLVAGTRDGVVQAWGDEAAAPLWTTRLASPAVMAMAVRPGGASVAFATNSGRIEFVDAVTGRALAPSSDDGHRWAVSSLAADPFGRFVASASWDGSVKLWDPATRSLLRTLRGHEGWVVAVDVSRDGRLVASSSHDGTVRLWDAATGDEVRKLEGHAGIVGAVRFDPDGAFVLSGGKDGDAVLWNVATGEVAGRFHGHADQVRGVAFLPCGRVVTASEDRTLRIWSRDTGRTLRVLEGHTDRVTAVDVTPDGARMVSAAHDGSVRVWDAESGACLRTFRGHRGWIHAVAVSPDGRYAVSAGQDSSVRRFDLVSGSPVDVLAGHDIAADAVAFSRSGSRLFTGGWDKRILAWDAPEQAR